MRGTASTHVDAPPEAVWALVSDITRMGEWSPECRGGAWLDGGGPEKGARFKGNNKVRLPWSTKSTVTEAEPGEVFAFHVGDDTAWRYDLTATDGGGTDVVESFEVLREPGAIMKFLTRVATGVPWSGRGDQLVAGMEQTLANLKRAAEADS